MEGKKYDYLIIGGGIAGVTAAETIRDKDHTASIAIISREPYVLYSRVLLPNFLKKRVDRDRLFLRKGEDFTNKRIDIFLGEEAAFVDVRQRQVGLSNHAVLGYQKLLIASGGKVEKWGPDEYQNFIFRLHTIDDADKLRGAITSIQNPLVVGGSFISLEFLEIFVVNGITPTLLVRDPYFFGRFLDPAGGQMLSDNFERHGIMTQFGDSISEIYEHEKKFKVLTQGLRRLDCDSFAVGIGLERNTDFWKGFDLTVGKGGILTNEYLETSQEGIFAAGDSAEFYDVIAGRNRVLGNWTNAFLQGKVAGLNMMGERAAFKTVSGYSIMNLGFHITLLGDYEDFTNTAVRHDKVHKKYERFFLNDGVLKGAAIINGFEDKSQIAKLIEAKIPLGEYENRLSDFTFDIRSIPV